MDSALFATGIHTVGTRGKRAQIDSATGLLCQQTGRVTIWPHQVRDNDLLEDLKKWSRLIKRDVVALYLAVRDPRVPWIAKVMAAATAAYAPSPIDLIPDFIPVLGYLDDLIIVPLAIVLTVRMIPPDVMADLRAEAEARLQSRPNSIVGAIFIVCLWICAGVGLVLLLR